MDNTADLEKRLLSAMMNGVELPVGLNEEDFSRQEHREIWSAMMKLIGKNIPPNQLLVGNELKAEGKLTTDKIQLLTFLERMEFSSARLYGYAAEVKKAAQLRRLYDLSKVLESGVREYRDPAELSAEAEKILGKVYKSEALKAERLEDIAKREALKLSHGEQEKGVLTGIEGLDRITGGFKPSQMIILAARPSMGKTALALNMATAISKRVPTVFFSLEMSRDQLAQRVLSSLSGVNSEHLQNGNLSEKEFEMMASGLEATEGLELWIDDASLTTITEMKMKAKRILNENKPGLIVIDYVQLLSGTGRNRTEELSELSRQLKSLAREMKVPVIVLSQLNRNVELRADKRPLLSDLRESGALEQDADIVLMLYREEYYMRDTENNLAEIIISKNRTGRTGVIKMEFDRETSQFKEPVNLCRW